MPRSGEAEDPTARSRDASVEEFLDEPTRDLDDWMSLWRRDLRFPVRSHRGLPGRLLVLFKRLFRPLVQVPQNDLWERQRVFNIILLEQIRESQEDLDRRVRNLETFMKEGLDEVMRYNDALYARVDQKLDAYRRQAQELSGRLQAALELAPAGSAGEDGAPRREEVARVVEEGAYVDFEGRFRGTSQEIADRLKVYQPWLEGRSEIVDLGCGRGEALELLAAQGTRARGVDASREMVRQCREKGLEAEESDLLEYLVRVEEESLDAVLSFHVIEHLSPEQVERLVRLAWRALRPGGVLILETPSPLSLLVGASRFWIDPTHRRPVHPATLRTALETAGFEQVERLDLSPFEADQRLPEIELSELGGEDLRRLADRVNRLRDRLDDLLYGFQDYGMVAQKAGAPRGREEQR